MPYIEPPGIDWIKQIDLLAYLQQCEPDELVRIGENAYSTKTHDSLNLSNGCWYWWSQGFGGGSALDYLVKVKGMTFLDAFSKLRANEIVLSATPYRLPNHEDSLNCRCLQSLMMQQSLILSSGA